MAPVDRIRKALGQEQAATFDRALGALADRVEQIAVLHEAAAPSLTLQFHRGKLVESRLQRDEVFA